MKFADILDDIYLALGQLIYDPVCPWDDYYEK